MRNIVHILGLPLLVGVASYFVPLTHCRIPSPLAQTAQALASRGEYGQPYPIELALTPQLISSVSGFTGEVLELALDVKHRFSEDANLRYEFEVLDDTGKSVAPALRSAKLSFPKARAQTFILTTPRLSRDGFYIVRAHVAAKSTKGEVDEQVADTYWQVAAGSLTQIESSTFFLQSRAGKGKRL